MIRGRLELINDSAKINSLKMFLFMSSTVTPRHCTYSVSSYTEKGATRVHVYVVSDKNAVMI